MKTPEAFSGQRHPLHRTRVRSKAMYAAIVAALSCGSAHAVEINYQFEFEGLHSNNLNLSEDNQAVETVLIPRLRFDVKEEGAALSLQARGEIERLHYTSNDFDDETRGEFAGQLNWSVFPGRMNFVVEDYLSLEPISIRDGRYPGNLQQLNVFLVGPTFFLRMGDVNRLQIDLRGADSNAEVTPGLDGQRYSAAAALQREFSTTSRASLNLVATKAQFDDPTAVVDYTRQDGFLRYENAFRNGQYEIDLGYSRLNRDLASDESTTIARATIQWQPDSRNQFRVRARQEFTDDVQDLVLRLRDPEEALIPDVAVSSAVTPGVYLGRLADIDYRYTGGRMALRLRPRYHRMLFVDNPGNDRIERGVYLRGDYRLTPRVTLFLEGLELKREFLSQEQNDRDHVYGLGVDYQLTRHWSWQAEVDHNVRESDLPDARYRENAVLFTIIWKR
jgi:hypothetical protein